MTTNHQPEEEPYMEYLREKFFEVHQEKKDLTPSQDYADSEFLMCFNGTGNEMQTVNEVARQVGCRKRTARRRLNRLTDEGVLDKKEVPGGFCANVYKLSIPEENPWHPSIIGHIASEATE